VAEGKIGRDHGGFRQPGKAFVQALRSLHSCIVRSLRRAGVAAIDLEDLTQDTLIDLMRRASELSALPRDELRAYANTTARHIAMNHARGAARRRARQEAWHQCHDRARYGRCYSAADVVDARRILGAMPAHLAEALVLSELHGLSRAEAATALGLNVGTLKTRLRTALTFCVQVTNDG
jgi:RNA polymerase sigma-70 factor, ECF subfamily